MEIPEDVFKYMENVEGLRPAPKDMTKGEKKLYELIWRRALASQMAQSKLNQVSLPCAYLVHLCILFACFGHTVYTLCI